MILLNSNFSIIMLEFFVWILDIYCWLLDILPFWIVLLAVRCEYSKVIPVELHYGSVKSFMKRERINVLGKGNT